MTTLLADELSVGDRAYQKRQTEFLRAALEQMGPGSKLVKASGRFFVLRSRTGEERPFEFPEPESRARYSGLPDQVGGIAV